MPVKPFHFILTVLLCACSTAIAQNGAQPQAVPLLPDIDPQDIEIKGNYRPQFQGLRRQPVLGFNPTPPVFSQEGPRIPFFETPEQVAAGTTVSFLERPPQPRIVLRNAPERKRDYLQAAFGNMITPELRFVHDVGGEINRSVTDVQFTASNGHLDERNTAYRFLDVSSVWLHRPLIDTDWKAAAQLQHGALYLFDPLSGAIPLAERQRRFTGFTASGEYKFNRGLYRNQTITASTGFESTALDNSPENESALTLGVRASGKKAASKTEQWWEYDAAFSGAFAASGTVLSDWMHLKTGVMYSARFASGWSWKAGLAPLAGKDSEGAKFYVLPEFDIRFVTPTWLDFRLSGAGSVQNLSPVQALGANRYLKSVDGAGNEYRYKSEAALSIRPSKLFSVHGSFSASHFFAYRYADVDASFDADGIDATDFVFKRATGVQLYRPAAGVKVWLEESGLVWYNEIYWQQIESGAVVIPFIEDLGLVSDLTWQFAQKWFGQATLRYTSARPSADPLVPLKAFLLVDLRLEYKINPKWGAYLSGQNLLNENYERMSGYRERPLQVLAGCTVRF